MKKIHSERHVNKQGLIPFIYKQNINELIDKVHRLENNMITDSISYGIVKSYTDWDLWFEAITDTVDGFVIPFGAHEQDGNLVSYAKKMGWVTEKPIPIQMYTGTKILVINDDGTYTVKYILDRSKYTDPCVEFIEKICVGKMKRLKNKTYSYYHDGIKEKKYYFMCGEVTFDRDNLTLIIDKIPYSDVYKRELIDAIRNLDLELLMANSNIVNFSNVLSACHDWCRDSGQRHWIGDYHKEKEENSNVYWCDR